MAGAADQDVLQVVLGQVHRAGGADQDAVLAQQAHGLFVETAVGGLAVLQVLLALDEGRRVGDHHVEAFVGGLQFAQGLEHVALDAGDLLRYAVQRRVALDAVEGEGGRVHAHHFAGAEGGGLDAPATDIAEQVEDPLALHVGRQARAVHAVVVEPAGLLPGQHRRLELHAVLFQRDPLRHFAVGVGHVALQALGVARAGVVLPEHGGGLEHLQQGSEHLVLAQFHGRGRQLHHQHVAEAIDHQAGQQVGIAVDQPVERLVEKPLAQAEGDVDAMNQQRFVENVLGITGNEAAADQIVRAQRDDAQRLAVGHFQHRLVAGGEGIQRRRGDIHLVAVDPQVAGAQAALGVGFETQAGQGHGKGSGKRARL